MAQQRRGLGRGLGALIPEASRTDHGGVGSVATQSAAEVSTSDRPFEPAAARPQPTVTAGSARSRAPISKKSRSTRSPPTHASRADLRRRRARRAGRLHRRGRPPAARRRAEAGPGSYELVMGERRLRASQRAGLDYIPAIVREMQDNDMLRDALIENLHRQQLDPLEEAAAYRQLLDDFGATHEQLAQRIGRSRPHISNTLRLLSLPPAVQKRVAAGGSSRATRARCSPRRSARPRAAGSADVAEGLSVRMVEEIVALGEGGPTKSRPGGRYGEARRAPPSETSPIACLISSRRRSRSRWGRRRARSSSSSPPSTTSSDRQGHVARSRPAGGVTKQIKV